MLKEDEYSKVLQALGSPQEHLQREDVQAFLAALDQPGKNAGRYRSWAKGRFHEPKPEGLSLLELEALVQFHRAKTCHNLALLAYGQTPMRLGLSTASREAIDEVVEFKALKEGADVVSFTKSDLDEFQTASLVEEAYASSLIEGAVTSRRIASDLARQKREPKNLSEQMLINNWLALRQLQTWRQQPLSPELLCEIQSVLTEKTGMDPHEVGAYRRSDDIVVQDSLTSEVIHHPPPATELRERMERLCLFAKQDQGLPGLVRAILIHHQIAFDHPFADGNGRIARLVFLLEVARDPDLSWVQYVPFSRAIADRKEAYYRSFVDTAEEAWDTTHFVRDQLRCLAIESQKLAGFMTDFVRRRDSYQKRLSLEATLNGRQVALIRTYLNGKADRFTQVGHARHHQVTSMTALRDFKQMVKWKLLSKRRDPKDGRQFLYWPTKRMAELKEASDKG